ncbi:hypothetical protein ABZ412_16530 [Nocardia sp. NPDC005746]|uniref:hypothetical protein n=1 Tax=Nocardia sp. NPDC005746 TaxID=3157062 RepID=UPI0033DA4435
MYGLLRVTRDRRWRPCHLGNAVYVLPISMLYEFGMCVYHLEIPKVVAGRKDPQELRGARDEILRKASRQLFKDYVAFPALSTRNWKSTVRANLTANVAKNMWEQIVTFCGHFPDGAEKFTRRDLATETRGEWYLRQFLGSANFPSGPVGRILTGSLGYQIEHHFPSSTPTAHPKSRRNLVGGRASAVVGARVWNATVSIFRIPFAGKALDLAFASCCSNRS